MLQYFCNCESCIFFFPKKETWQIVYLFHDPLYYTPQFSCSQWENKKERSCDTMTVKLNKICKS